MKISDIIIKVENKKDLTKEEINYFCDFLFIKLRRANNTIAKNYLIKLGFNYNIENGKYLWK
jgi:hypothetical protein